MIFTNNRINESIIQDLTNLLIRTEKAEENKIKEKTTPQFKKDLSSIWNILNDETRNKILYMMPKSWNRDDFYYEPPKVYA